MIDRREFLLLLLGSAALTVTRHAAAQEPGGVRRVGVLLSVASDDPEAKSRSDAFVSGLRDLGWEAGRNIDLQYRWTPNADLIAKAAQELISLQPEVILSASTPQTIGLLHETQKIPVVFVQVTDPIGSGIVDNLGHPGQNATGFTNLEASVLGKWFDLLQQTVPTAKRVAIMYNPQTAPDHGAYFFKPFSHFADKFGVSPVDAPVLDESDIEDAVTKLASSNDAALFVVPDIFNTAHRAAMIAQAAKYKIPAIYSFGNFATEGGLISYGVDIPDLYTRAADYVSRILRGAKPGELPVQAPLKFDLVVNVQTAKALGITFPSTLLAIADEVIE